MIYSDSSFIVSLYLPRDFFHGPALKIARGFTDPIPFTPLTELEVLNTLQRMIAGKHLSAAEYERAVLQLEKDLAEGILSRAQLNQIELYRSAKRLSKRYSPQLACRTLDILHVASALVLQSKSICSFDRRQRELAKAIGLALLPKNLRPVPLKSEDIPNQSAIDPQGRAVDS